MSSDLLVRMEGIDKSFPGVQALADARFELRPGEVHALVGENGAGKSTLMKVLSGIYRKDAGTIWYKGQEVDIPNPRAGLDLGISMIHQELVLAPHLTVAQNIFMGREPRGRARLRRGRQASGRADRRAHRTTAPAARPEGQGEGPQGRPAADGLDRPGPLRGRVRPHHGRADGGPHEHRDRRALPHHPDADVAREWASSTSPIASRSCARSPIGSRSCVTGVTWPRWRRRPSPSTRSSR